MKMFTSLFLGTTNAAAMLDITVLDGITDVQEKFQTWQALFNVTIPDSAGGSMLRGTTRAAGGSLEAFIANDKIISSHNARNDTTFALAHNQFSALTSAEFKAMYLSAPMPRPEGVRPVDFGVSDTSALPSEVDWTTKGAVTPVKNQGSCGSCWSFSTTGALEGAFFIKNGGLQSFSEQQLVSCASSSGNNGCNGGLMDAAFTWVKEQGGICTEDAYPYTGTDSACSSSCSTVPGSAPTTFTDVAASESALQSALSKQPVSIAIEADQSALQLYSSGVLTGACGTNLDHGVLAVGYGTDADTNTDYYRVKNSWGGTWGDAGYINIERGSSQNGGQCGILLSASYPTL
jgi:C1A family cysteine protease